MLSRVSSEQSLDKIVEAEEESGMASDRRLLTMHDIAPVLMDGQ